MNFGLQPRFSPPFRMNPPRFPMASPWPSASFRQPYPPIYRNSQPSYPPMAYSQSINPFSNARYHQMKQTRDHPHRRSMRRPSRVSKTKSSSELPPQSYPTSTPLPKAHSWHSMAHARPGNFSVAYAQEMHLGPKQRRKRSQRRKKKQPVTRPLPSSPKRQPSFRAPRKRPAPLPERGVVRISTFDELPLRINPRYKRKNSINTDRLSTKGSVTTTSTKSRMKSKERATNTRPKKTNTEEQKRTRREVENRSPSSSSMSSFDSSLSSAQRHLNGSLRSDPLISAAMEDFRRFRRSSSPSTIINSHRRSLRHESECSDSTVRSPSRSRSHSQSSFTSVERVEIRQLIQTMKTKESNSSSVERPSPPTPIPPTPPSKRASSIYSRRSVPMIKTRKSSLTEELDREFSKLRSLDPDQELNYVIPSAISKRKKPIEIPPPPGPPAPTFTELLRQVQLRPIDTSSISTRQVKAKASNEVYKSPPPVVAVPQSSPTPPYEPPSPPPEEVKHEYAKPMKKPVENSFFQISHFQPTRHLGRNKPPSIPVPEKRQSRSLGMFNWFNSNGGNLLPATFQPTRSLHQAPEHTSTSVKENIYTSDINVHLPFESNEQNALETELENRTILTDYYYSDYDLKDSTATKTPSTSLFRDLTRVFTHQHEHKSRLHGKASSRCSLM